MGTRDKGSHQCVREGGKERRKGFDNTNSVTIGAPDRYTGREKRGVEYVCVLDLVSELREDGNGSGFDLACNEPKKGHSEDKTRTIYMFIVWWWEVGAQTIASACYYPKTR